MKKWTFLLFVFLLLFAACGTKEDSNEKDNNTDENHMKGDGDVSLLTDANNHLAFDLLFATMETVDDNVFLSPSNLYITEQTEKQKRKWMTFSSSPRRTL